MSEEWRDIPGFEGTYQASNLGNIRRISSSYTYVKNGKPLNRKKQGQLLKPKYKKHGYAFVALGVGKTKPVYKHIHRLVAAAFLGDNPNLQVNHKDQNKTNNRLNNLEWVTCQENRIHSIKLQNHNTVKLTVDDVLNIRKELNQGIKPTTLAKKYKVHVSGIYNIKRRDTWSYV